MVEEGKMQVLLSVCLSVCPPCTPTQTTQTHFLEHCLQGEKESERLYWTNSGRCQSQVSASACQPPLRGTNGAGDKACRHTSPPGAARGLSMATREGARWHFVAWCHCRCSPACDLEALGANWVGAALCIGVYIWYRVGANTVGRVEGSGGLTPSQSICCRLRDRQGDEGHWAAVWMTWPEFLQRWQIYLTSEFVLWWFILWYFKSYGLARCVKGDESAEPLPQTARLDVFSCAIEAAVDEWVLRGQTNNTRHSITSAVVWKRAKLWISAFKWYSARNLSFWRSNALWRLRTLLLVYVDFSLTENICCSLDSAGCALIQWLKKINQKVFHTSPAL